MSSESIDSGGDRRFKGSKIRYAMQATLPVKDPQYTRLLNENRWDEYLDGLCRDGLAWWFNLDIGKLAAHLRPLARLGQNRLKSNRIRLFMEARRLPLSSKNWTRIYHNCLNANDHEAAVAAAGAAVSAIWEDGSDFQRFIPWYRELCGMQRHPARFCVPARAYLLLFKGLIEMEGMGHLHAARVSFRQAESIAETANSPSLQLLSAVLYGYSLFYSGDLERLDFVLFDSRPLCRLSETAYWCSVHFSLLEILNRIVKGYHHDARQNAAAIVEAPTFPALPLSTRLMALGYHLLATIGAGDMSVVNRLSERIQDVIVPSRNHLNHALVHCTLGTACLEQGNARQALLHAKEAQHWAGLCGSPLKEERCALLLGQALSELQHNQEAIAQLSSLLDSARESSHELLKRSAAVELAGIMIRQGRIDSARDYMQAACTGQPSDTPLYIMNRPSDFIQKYLSLLPEHDSAGCVWMERCQTVICIETFGNLQIHYQGQRLHETGWRGGSTKKLLKAIIVFGGRAVAGDHLIDILWPDADGDRARNNLKVALSRLRRTVCPSDKQPVPWLTVQNGQVSITPEYCTVDALLFEESLNQCLENQDPTGRLGRLLDCYKADFLINDVNDIWIINFRRKLKALFVRGVVELAERSRQSAVDQRVIAYLNRAANCDPLNEAVYASLMRLYLNAGFPANALQVFEQARQALSDALGIEPGPVLQELAHKARGM